MGTSCFLHSGILIFTVWQVIVLNVQLYYSFLKYTDTMAHFFFPSPSPSHAYCWQLRSLIISILESVQLNVSEAFCRQNNSPPEPTVKQRVYLQYSVSQINQMTPGNNIISNDWKASREAGTLEVTGLKKACFVPSLLLSSPGNFGGWQWRCGPLSSTFIYLFLAWQTNALCSQLTKKAKHLEVWRAKNIWRLVFKNTLSFQKA